MCEDQLFVFSAVERTDRLAVTAEPLYFYRKNIESATWYFNRTAEHCKQGIEVAVKIAEIVGREDEKNCVGYKDYLAQRYYAYCAYLAERRPSGWKAEMEQYRVEYLKNFDSSRIEKKQGAEKEFVTSYKSWLVKRSIYKKKMQIKRLLKRA